jgi:hypothetical protein
MFRTVFPSIIRSSELYIQQQAYVKRYGYLLASGNEMESLLFDKRTRELCVGSIILCVKWPAK